MKEAIEVMIIVMGINNDFNLTIGEMREGNIVKSNMNIEKIEVITEVTLSKKGNTN